MPVTASGLDRVEVRWHRGDEGVWYRGTLLEGGRVQFDESWPFVDEGAFVLEREEIADCRPAGPRRAPD